MLLRCPNTFTMEIELAKNRTKRVGKCFTCDCVTAPRKKKKTLSMTAYHGETVFFAVIDLIQVSLELSGAHHADLNVAINCVSAL